MKRLLRMVSFLVLMGIVIPSQATNIVPNSLSSRSATENVDPRAEQLIQRLNEIKDISRSEMSRAERKELRKEVKDIKKEMKVIKGGVYLSVGAIIIIILLLILIL